MAALDIREGDILVIDGTEYPVRSAAWWNGRITFSGFSRLASVTASTKRSPTLSGGKIGAAVTNLTNVLCTPLDPVDAEVRQRLALNTPHEVLQVYAFNASGFAHLIVEELKR